MDWEKLLQIGAEYIRNNDDDATTNLDIGAIVGALSSILGSNENDGGIDLGSLVRQAQESGLIDVVMSWIGSGENAPIEPENVTNLVPEEKVREFAEQLGISEESARKALADALPKVVDEATNEEPSLAEQVFEQIGGVEGAINILKKFI
ncbi:MAG: DUF937 domain-containing protein [Epsilonproteobacteria bacterium]|nr:hypothetical protein [Campylobacterota bacterium]NPA56907.1 DUF937 domain-containing protein [Campylobacterota bacterium]